MFVYVSKILLPLVQPLGLCAALWLAAFVCYLRGRARAAAVLLVVGATALSLAASPLVGARLLGALEDDFPCQEAAAYPVADAIVVLGGVTAPPVGPRTSIDVGNGFDRLLHGMRLLRAGRAPVLILSGGAMAALSGSTLTEAARLRALATEYGIDSSAILTESASRSTYENAVAVKTLMAEHGMARILLVTSAYHMRRAAATFRAQDVDVIPAPTDVQVVPTPFHPGRLVPTFTGLEYTSRAAKEHVGWWVYWLRGWIE